MASRALPSSARLLTAVHRDLLQGLAPELHSASSQAIVKMMDVILRYVIARESMSEQSGCAPSMAAEAQALRAWERQEASIGATSDAVSASVTLAQLQDYLRWKLPQRPALSVTRIERILGGFSKNTYIAHLSNDGLEEGIVIRVDLPNGPIESSAATEFRLVRALFAAGIPVAEPLWQEESRELFGMPFQVSRRVGGVTLSPAPDRAGDEAGQVASFRLAEFLARLHRLDPTRLCLPQWDPSRTMAEYVRGSVDEWKGIWRRKQLEPSLIMETAFEWLGSHVPAATGRASVIHGDAGQHNLMIENGRVTAMLDWELAHFGDPAEDLEYCRTWVEKAMPWAQFVGHYEAHGGLPYDESRSTFYRVFGAVRNAVCCAAGMRGFCEARLPESKSAFAGIWYYRFWLLEIERILGSVEAR